MAGKGWYIDGYVFDSVWRFRKGKPSKRRYNAVLMPGSSSVDIDESGDTKMFRDFCTEAGWILEYGGIVWQIFYTEDESLLPIDINGEFRTMGQALPAVDAGFGVGELVRRAGFPIDRP